MNFSPYGQFNPVYQQPPMTQQNTPPMQPQSGFVCRAVTSREEAIAVQTDYFSPGTIMPDMGHGVVYMKRFNPNTGSSDFYTFTLQREQPPPETPVFATAQEVAELRAEIAKLKEVKTVADE